MALGEPIRIQSKSPYLHLKIYKGHFATSHAHMNYFIDIASNKASLKEARAVAQALAGDYRLTTQVDTVLCLDGTEVIGACLGNALTDGDRFNVNRGREIFVLTPEHTAGSQLIFRDNTVPMIREKAVLILAASVVTGYTALSAVEAVQYFGGTPVGICSIFSNISDCAGIPVRSVFHTGDLTDYQTSSALTCPMCRRGEKITALVNSFGCSAL